MAKRKNRPQIGINTTPPQPNRNSPPQSQGIIDSTINHGAQKIPNGKPPASADRSLHNRIESKFDALAQRIK